MEEDVDLDLEEEEEVDEEEYDPFRPFRPPYFDPVQGPEEGRARATVEDLLNLLGGVDLDSSSVSEEDWPPVDLSEEGWQREALSHITPQNFGIRVEASQDNYYSEAFAHQERNWRNFEELPRVSEEDWQREALSHITPLSFDIRVDASGDSGASHENLNSAQQRRNFINFEEFCRVCPPEREEWKQRVEEALGFGRMDPPRVGSSTAGYIPTRCLCGANPNDQGERAHICRCVPPAVRHLFRNRQVPEYHGFEEAWVVLYGHEFQNPIDLSDWIVVSASNTSPVELQRRLRRERATREWASLERAEELTRGGDQSLQALAEYTRGRIQQWGPTATVAATVTQF